MATSTFGEFVKRKTGPSIETEWSEQRAMWLNRLDELYSLIGRYLDEFTRQGLILITRDKTDLHEEHIGAYPADTLIIEIGASIVRIQPMGILLKGCVGHADMIGRRSTARIVLTPRHVGETRFKLAAAKTRAVLFSEPDWAWKIVVYGVETRFITLGKRSFQNCLMAVAGA